MGESSTACGRDCEGSWAHVTQAGRVVVRAFRAAAAQSSSTYGGAFRSVSCKQLSSPFALGRLLSLRTNDGCGCSARVDVVKLGAGQTYGSEVSVVAATTAPVRHTLAVGGYRAGTGTLG
jgi:hypothetical protein